MLTINLNGREEKLNIECRTFVSLDTLLKILKVDVRNVALNGETVNMAKFARTTISSGDNLKIA